MSTFEMTDMVGPDRFSRRIRTSIPALAPLVIGIDPMLTPVDPAWCNA